MGAVKMGIDEVVSYLKTTSNHNAVAGSVTE